jgi:drug/metabolite transporter (DMT)-like permease
MFLLPLVGAVLWGLWYVLAEEGLQNISVATWMFISAMGALAVAFALHFFGPDQIDLKPAFASKRILTVILGCIVVAELAGLSIAYSLKELPTSYVAILEVCYPIFVPIFAYVILKQNQFDMSTMLGTALVLSGVLCIVFFHTQESSAEKVAKAEESIVVAMPAYNTYAPDILWNQWPQKSTLSYMQEYLQKPALEYVTVAANQNNYLR